jgi:hypothetical protein
MLFQVEGLLSPAGQLFMVTVADNDPQEILEILGESCVTGAAILQAEALLHCIAMQIPQAVSVLSRRDCADQES